MSSGVSSDSQGASGVSRGQPTPNAADDAFTLVGMARAQDVAAALIEEHPGVDQMELHKLLYLVQAASLAWFEEAAFQDERIEAWKWGPVVRGVAGSYMQFDRRPITEPMAGDSRAVDNRTRWVIQQVVKQYGELSGPKLAGLVKGPGSPWSLVRANLANDAPSNIEIPIALMYEFHRRSGISTLPVSTMSPVERRAVQAFTADPSADAMADLFETVTGVRAKVTSS